jgi:hypothetical protein
MPVLLLFALFASELAIGQSRRNDPCYAYRPDELERLPVGVCEHVTGPRSGRGGADRSQSDSQRDPGRGEEGPGRRSAPAASDGGGNIFDPIGEARARGLRSPHSAREHAAAVALANRLLPRAISIATAQIRRGERVAGASPELLQQAREVLTALQGARIVDGADGCAVNPDSLAFVTSHARGVIHVCPKLGDRWRNRDKAVIFILVHEGAHLSGISDEGQADEAAALILDYTPE